MSGSQRRGGMIQVQIGGVMQDVGGDFVANLGSALREDVEGSNKILGYTEKPQPGMIKGTVFDRADLDVAALLATDGETVTLVQGNGKVVMLRDAWQCGSGEIKTENGAIEVEFHSRHPAEET